MGDRVQVRAMDDLGRVVVPRDMRDALGWVAGTTVEISMSDAAGTKYIVLRDASPRCSLCREQRENLKKIERGYICPECTAQI